MKKLSKKNSLLLYSVVLTIVFYLLPSLFKGGIISLFVINPITIFVFSIIFSKSFKFNLFKALIAGLLFFPTIFIFYNSSAWIYVVFYIIISIVGGFIGSKLNKDK